MVHPLPPALWRRIPPTQVAVPQAAMLSRMSWTGIPLPSARPRIRATGNTVPNLPDHEFAAFRNSAGEGKVCRVVPLTGTPSADPEE